MVTGGRWRWYTDTMTADWAQGVTSADDAVACVRSGMRIFIHGAAATPTPLIEPLARRTDLEDVTPYHLHTSGPAPFATPEQQGRFFSVSLFTGPPLCAAIDDGRADFMPVFLSDIPSLFDSGLIPIDVALLQLLAARPPRLLHARHLRLTRRCRWRGMRG